MPWTLVSTAVLAAIAAAPVAAAEDGLARHLWTSRILVVVAPRLDDTRLVEQTRLIQTAGRGTRERDLAVVAVSGSSAQAEALRRRFGIRPDAFRVILVGKDGGAKLSEAEPIGPERLFAEIDAMPMRRDEMRRRTSGRGQP